jgi:DNA-binding MarR family transcriptional regulator
MSTDTSVRAFEALNHAQVRLAGLVEAALLRSTGLALKEVEMLDELGRRGPTRLNELAVVLAMSASGLSRLADRLQSDGLVERRRCGSDHRGSYAGLTERGREVREAAVRARDGVLEALLTDLPGEQVQDLTTALDSLRTALRG